MNMFSPDTSQPAFLLSLRNINLGNISTPFSGIQKAFIPVKYQFLLVQRVQAEILQFFDLRRLELWLHNDPLCTVAFWKGPCLGSSGYNSDTRVFQQRDGYTWTFWPRPDQRPPKEDLGESEVQSIAGIKGEAEAAVEVRSEGTGVMVKRPKKLGVVLNQPRKLGVMVNQLRRVGWPTSKLPAPVNAKAVHHLYLMWLGG
ncbi:hypothetical protein DFP72DRAFT_860322 [Ephemerocybe angulata]|uniref:Uncharacterized protein n=1 Tax=Ephemerocybe angulata TaxID=980116 RepID=A0A8H6LTZ3_9AGAR|nr:hypothetical protein DFP72DRAFT_860322 [Tulosesus angulatus]